MEEIYNVRFLFISSEYLSLILLQERQKENKKFKISPLPLFIEISFFNI